METAVSPKLQIRKVHVGDQGVNSYIVACAATKECIVIDPGANSEKILANLEGAVVRAILLTQALPESRRAVSGGRRYGAVWAVRV
jgi:glyoxylase-like metal-dependent hydrolase (beta-lactamase superfamily II)